MTPERAFNDYLKRKGLKKTPERRMVLEGVLSMARHFDADLLHDTLKEGGKRISRASVYRTIPLLVESGLIRESVGSQNTAQYEYVFGHDHHDHLVCIACGRVIEFRVDEIERLQAEICKKYRFTYIDHELKITGLCEECT
jgi:Fur family ferric uptake transcriptional regulator